MDNIKYSAFEDVTLISQDFRRLTSVGSNLKTVWHLLEIPEILETYSVRELQREWSVQSSSRAFVIVCLKSNTPNSKWKLPSSIMKTPAWLIGWSMRDYWTCWTLHVWVCVCLMETEWEQPLTLGCVCVNMCTPTAPVQMWLHLYACACFFFFACVLLHVCV